MTFLIKMIDYVRGGQIIIMSDYNKILQLKKENPYYANIIDEIDSYYNMTLKRINHEFGNAITLINSSLQIIESSHPEVHKFKYWNSAMEDVRHMVKLVSAISNYNNSKSIVIKQFNITDLLNNIVESFSINPLFSHISYNVHVNDNIPLIFGDDIKLRQVFINLLKNAAESISKKGIINVHLNMDSSKTNLLISVSDNGCGITDEQIKNIFSPMVSYKPNGTGLGLPIIKKIIEAHNGSISVQSTYGEGSTFTISLPVTIPQTETTDPTV